MRMDTTLFTINSNPSIIVEHEGERLVFAISFSAYRKSVFTGEFNVFSQINDYWADQPLHVQAEIFAIYRQIFDAFDQFLTKVELREYLQLKVQELFSYHSLDTIREWIAFRATDIRLPASIKEVFIPDTDRNMVIDKTYLASDYRQLVALALALRCMIPVWSEYIGHIKRETDSNYIEMVAFQLIDRVLVPELPVIEKLLNYIQNTISLKNLFRTSNVFRGISSSDYPRWLLSIICTRSLAAGDIRGLNPDAHLVTFIHMSIINRASDGDGDRRSGIKDKKIDDRSDGDEGGPRSSALERYKVKANVSIGDTTEIEFFLSDAERVARRLAPGISMEEVRRGIRHMENYKRTPTTPQVNFLRIVFKPIISQEGMLYMNNILIKRMMGILEAVLASKPSIPGRLIHLLTRAVG